METTGKTIFDKLFEIQQMDLSFKRTKKAAYGTYCPLDEVWKVLKPILTQKKLLVYFIPREGKLITLIKNMEITEDPLTCEFDLLPKETQKMGADITYFKRYSLGALFNIITDDDTDGNKHKESKVFGEKECEEFKKRSIGKPRDKVMQQILKIKKEYEISKDIGEHIDLFLKDLK